jgi:prepilin-type N-terminal cleavage/methylation domain-containing protein
MKHSIKNQKGFTLIELLVTISIISMLSSVAYAGYGAVKSQSRDTKRAADTVQLRTALTSYELDHGGVPAGSAAAGCAGSPDNETATTWTCSTSSSLSAVLTPLVTGKYISAIPTDPLDAGGYSYYYSSGSAQSTDPVTGVLLAKNASFDYVNESKTASLSTPTILGVNVGAPDYGTYPGSGYPTNSASVSIITNPNNNNVAPSAPTGLTANVSLGGTFLGSGNASEVANALLAVAQQGGGGGTTIPSSSVVSVNLSWNAPTNTTNITGYTVVPSYTASTVTGSSMSNGTTYPISSSNFSSSYTPAAYTTPQTITYSIAAYNAYGTSSPVTVTVKVPETRIIIEQGTYVSNVVSQTPITKTATPTLMVPGATYTIRYSTNGGSTFTSVGTATVDSSGVASISTPYAGIHYWQADLHSLPTFTQN